MFGGWGVYHRGLMFALVSDDTLYLKADAELAPAFEALGLPPFRYARRGREVALSFYQAPEDLYDDPDEARHWGGRALAAALRSATSARPRGAPRKRRQVKRRDSRSQKKGR